MLVAVMLGAAPGLLSALLAAVVSTAGLAADIAAGVLIAALPQCWFVTRGTRSRVIGAAAVLAMGKYGLAAAGFALWFVARPEANGLATVAATAVTMATTTLATYGLLRRLNRPSPGKSPSPPDLMNMLYQHL